MEWLQDNIISENFNSSKWIVKQQGDKTNTRNHKHKIISIQVTLAIKHDQDNRITHKGNNYIEVK